MVGAGDATGGAVARRFAREGYVVCATRRSQDKLEPLLSEIRQWDNSIYVHHHNLQMVTEIHPLDKRHLRRLNQHHN